MKNRIVHIDIAKGITITLVAMFHSKIRLFVPEIIEPLSLFRMPLFFFLSGVFFSASINPREFTMKKWEALLKPYFSVLILIYFISFLLNQNFSEGRLWGIFYGNGDTIRFRWAPMWFLTHLFAVYCFSYILFRYTYFNKCLSLMKWTCLILILTIGALNIDMFVNKDLTLFGRLVDLPGLPFSIDIILITSVFFIAGNFLKEEIINFIPNNILLSISILFFIYISFFTESHIDLNKRVYTSPVFATLGAVSGIYVIMFLSYSISKYKTIKNIFTILGSSSLYILIFHYFIGNNIYSFVGNYIENSKGLFFLSVIAFLLSISLPLAIKWVVKRNSFLALFFLPFKSNKLLQRKRIDHN